MGMKLNRVKPIVLSALMIFSGFSVCATSGDDVKGSSEKYDYSSYKLNLDDKNYSSEDIEINKDNLVVSESTTTVKDTLYNVQDVIEFNKIGDQATFDFYVPDSKIYNLMFDYAGLEGTTMDIQIAVYIDDMLLFDEMSELELLRWWKNSKDEWTVDREGNQVTSEQIESFGFRKQYIYDKIGIEKDNYKFDLTKGNHKIKIVSKQEPFAIKNVTFTSIEKVSLYKNILSSISDKKDYSGDDIVIQGEDAIEKSSCSLTSKSDTLSSAVQPDSSSTNLVNYIGNTNWSTYGQSIKWKVNIDEDKLYNIGFHYKQSYVVNGNVYRSLKIDGKYPFEESRNISFGYDTKWQYIKLTDENGETCKVHLDKGEHTIELVVALGPISGYFEKLNNIVKLIGDDYLKIAMITGETPDASRDYDLFYQIPNLEKDFNWAVDELKSLSNEMSSTSSKNSTQYITTIKGTTRILKQMVETKYKAHTYKKDLYSQYCNLSSMLYELLDMPLSLDEIRLTAPNAKDPVYTNFGKEIKHFFSQFIYTFVDDYSSIQKNYDTTLKLWTTWGRDQTQVLNSLIAESFTPKYGIDVNVQITGATVIQGMLTNNAPDLALGVARSNPVNYALRNAIYDLSKFSDFDEVLKRFNEGAEEPYKYNGGCYALPDTQSFDVLYYRTDIFENLGLKVPETWEDFIEATSVIQRNKMNVFLPTPDSAVGSTLTSLGIFPTLLMQNNVDMYNSDRNKTMLDSENAVALFTQWTDIYTKYKVPVSSDFYNRFRVGVTPLGIAPYTTYNTLTAMAPDIEGRWGISLVPGSKVQDSINHTASGGGTGCIILNDSKQKDASWEFLKWWTSADTQYRFSKNVESLLGATGRIATSNKEAMKKYSWKTGDLDILLEQWKNVKELPEVPGSYYLQRSIMQAFYSVQNGTSTPNDALIKWNNIINEEIDRKIKEYK